MRLRLYLFIFWSCVGIYVGLFGAMAYEVSAQSPIIKARLAAICEGLASEDYEGIRPYFHAQLKPIWPVKRLANTWQRLNYQLQGFAEWGAYTVDTTQWRNKPVQVIYQHIYFQRGELLLVLSFTEDGDIIGFFFSRDK